MARGKADSPGVDARDACSPLNSTPSCKVERSSVARSSSRSLSRRLGHTDLAMYCSRSTSRCLAVGISSGPALARRQPLWIARTEAARSLPISAAQPFCILGKTREPPGAGAPIGEWSRDYSEDREPYRRWPSPRPRIPARRRRAPTVRFITFDTLVTGVRAFE